ncbi:sensor histidine kinase [Radicibacter daui]|uniref:sensor histidine kinase n=1 Tax=Radicibacter daui TaxID=3064829 RepID=UPI004046F91B
MLSSLLEGLTLAPYGFALFDTREKLLFFNARAVELFPGVDSLFQPGLPYEEVTRIWARAAGSQQAMDEAQLRLDQWRALGSQQSLTVELQAGLQNWVMATHTRLSTGETFSTYIDISALKARTQEAEEARRRAELAERAKAAFLSNMSHELRTPLNAIIGFSDLLRFETFGPIGDAHYRDYAEDIHQSGNKLLALLNDILDLSRIDAGRHQLQEEAMEVLRAMEVAMRSMREQAEREGLAMSLAAHSSARLPLLFADPRALRQMLMNLLSNAIRFNRPGGSIRLEAGIRADGALILGVADTGIGMSAEEIELAVSPFGQVDTALGRRHQGSGLGLPIVRALMGLHGGALEIDSQPGQGTLVRLVFPVGRLLKPAVS